MINRKILTSGTLAGFLLIMSFWGAEKLNYGEARVVDGDTIAIEETKIRLQGIDAPEKKQQCKNMEGKQWNCGIEATDKLTEIIGEGRVLCFRVDRDKYKRLVSICYNNKLENINAKMVREGFAVAYRQYSTLYIKEEEAAKGEGKGIWSGSFEVPSDFRKKQHKKLHS